MRTSRLVPPWRIRLQRLLESPRFQHTVMALIILNGIVLGLETSQGAMARAGALLRGIDSLLLGIFVVEIGLAMAAYGSGFFRQSWRLFDLFVVAIALVPTLGPFSVMRAFRVLRIFRLLTVSRSMRRVAGALLSAIPGMSSIISLLLVFFYVFGVMATKLFGAEFPDWFGTLGRSMYTLFQIMTLESWSMGIVRPVLEKFPVAWMFFIPFICVATFTMLNLFIAVIVNSMQSQTQEAQEEEMVRIERLADEKAKPFHEELDHLRREMAALRQALRETAAASPPVPPNGEPPRPDTDRPRLPA